MAVRKKKAAEAAPEAPVEEVYVDVASARRVDGGALLTVAGQEHFLTPHDCQSLWRELNSIVPVL